MSNGEGAEEKQDSAIASLCDPPHDRASDSGDDLSQYSSCEGGSELDRYCSANSAMGTPSLAGSFQDSDFGSLKSFKLEGQNAFLSNPGQDRVSSNHRESEGVSDSGRVNELCCDGSGRGMLLNGRIEDFVASDLAGKFDVDIHWGKEGLFENGEGSVGIPVEFQVFGDGKANHTDVEKVFDEEGESSLSSAHSEGDDSMFGCGSDDESKMHFYYGKSELGEESWRKENQLVMNSSVAFGSDDWDEYFHESGENSIVAMPWDELQAGKQTNQQTGLGSLSSIPQSDAYLHLCLRPQNEFKITPVESNQVKADGELAEVSLSTISTNLVKHIAVSDDSKTVLAPSNQVSAIDDLVEHIECSPAVNIFQTNMCPSKEEAVEIEELKYVESEPEIEELKYVESEPEIKNQDRTTSSIVTICNPSFETRYSKEATVESNPLSETVRDHQNQFPVKGEENGEGRLLKDGTFFISALAGVNTISTIKENISLALDRTEDHFMQFKTGDVELNDFHDEVVDDMQDILLDLGESPQSGITHGPRLYQSPISRSSRDGGSSASTSGGDYAFNWIQQVPKIDRVQVVGARQKEGDVCFSERLVGVKKYAVYKIKVWSGEDHWEVERRYRDFSTLYHRLKKLFAERGWSLPSPWSSVERESWKLFGNASLDVIADRSVLIQECLQSVIHTNFSSGSLNALSCFLSPSEVEPHSPASDTSVSRSSFSNKGEKVENSCTFGKTISLVVDSHPLKSIKQMLDVQHYRCAGCRRNFDEGTSRVQGFVAALGWGKPRYCEYSGQLFCSSCHMNDTAIIPSKVLHSWDFTLYPVSQLAKSFLDSINDQPMLCVSAVNPFLFSKVPALQHVANIRSRIRAMLPCVRCPFRRSIYKGLGPRSYILDSNDFFALKDLIDLSKGVFSALPAMVESVSRKIQDHITEQCLVCYDVGVPCSARRNCNNPLAVIFPFQEGEIEKCRSCELVFHKICFKKIGSCPCGGGANCSKGETKRSDAVIQSTNGNFNLQAGTVEHSSGLLASLFSKVMPVRSQIHRKQDPEDIGNVILMGSLPNNSL